MAAHRTSFPLWKGTCTDPRNFSLYLSIHSLLFSAEPENKKTKQKHVVANKKITSNIILNKTFISD